MRLDHVRRAILGDKYNNMKGEKIAPTKTMPALLSNGCSEKSRGTCLPNRVQYLQFAVGSVGGWRTQVVHFVNVFPASQELISRSLLYVVVTTKQLVPHFPVLAQ